MEPLYEITSMTGGCFTLTMKEKHPVYAGHFPGNPITPGVLTLQMVKECIARMAGSELQYASIKSCRFAAMVKPGDHLKLEVDKQATEDGKIATKATLRGENSTDDIRLQIDATLEKI